MADTNILQSSIATQFIYPFLLIFFLVFAILEKTKILSSSKQIHALIAFIIGLIFVTAIGPKIIVGNMILFLTVAIVMVFVILLLWGFVYGDSSGFKPNKFMKIGLGAVITIAMIFAILWATGLGFGVFDNLFNKLFNSSWSKSFWSNFLFIFVIAAALAIAIGAGKKAP